MLDRTQSPASVRSVNVLGDPAIGILRRAWLAEPRLQVDEVATPPTKLRVRHAVPSTDESDTSELAAHTLLTGGLGGGGLGLGGLGLGDGGGGGLGQGGGGLGLGSGGGGGGLGLGGGGGGLSLGGGLLRGGAMYAAEQEVATLSSKQPELPYGKMVVVDT